MKTFPVYEELSAIEVALEHLFLDPNNPRFAEFNGTFVPDSAIEAVQQRVQQILMSSFAVDKLIMNMEVNGYLPIDRVVVREFERDKYVVLEGNRRICAAKAVAARISKGFEGYGQ